MARVRYNVAQVPLSSLGMPPSDDAQRSMAEKPTSPVEGVITNGPLQAAKNVIQGNPAAAVSALAHPFVGPTDSLLERLYRNDRPRSSAPPNAGRVDAAAKHSGFAGSYGKASPGPPADKADISKRISSHGIKPPT